MKPKGGFLHHVAGRFVQTLLSFRYRVDVRFEGTAREAIFDDKNGTLVIFNHPTWGIEGTKVFSVLTNMGVRPISVAAAGQIENPVLNPLAHIFEAISIPEMTLRDGSMQELQAATKQVEDALANQRVVIIAGAGRIYRSRIETMGSMTAPIIAQNPKARIVTAYADGLWGSRFGYAATGGYPQIGKTLLEGLKSLILNFGFIPKHPWRLTFVEQTEKLRGLTPVEINEELKGIFNTTEKGRNHPRGAIRYKMGWWDRTVPVPDPIITQVAGEIEAVSDTVRRDTVEKLIEISGNQEIKTLPLDSPDLLRRRLREDVGMDSLASADFILWVEEYTLRRTGTKFQIENTEGLVTIQDAILAANGQAKIEAPPPMNLPTEAWLQDGDNMKGQWKTFSTEAGEKEVFIPEKVSRYEWDGVPFPIHFLNRALKDPKGVTIADPNFSAPPLRRILQVMLGIYPTIKNVPGERIGVLLPSGMPVFAATQVIRLSGKVPVFLNHTTGIEAVRNAVRITGVKHVLTSSLVLSKIKWGDAEKHALGIEWVEFEKIRKSITFFKKLKVLWGSYTGAAKKFLDAQIRPEAAILVTSGSEGMPKSIAITDEMLGLLLQQLLEPMKLCEEERLLQTGPPFHVLGFIAGIVLPSVTRVRVGLIPNPTDYKQLATFAELFNMERAVTPPAFAEGMAASSLPGQLAHIRHVLYGAQAMSPAQRATIKQHSPRAVIIEGYGATETTGGLMFEHYSPKHPDWMEILPSTEFQHLDLETRKIPVPPGGMGVLYVRGPTIIQAYLEAADDKMNTASKSFVEIDGRIFFCTGDLLRSHPKAPRHFQFVTRVSRTFKDKAGEFINPDQIEEALSEAFPRLESDPPGPVFAVTGAPHPEGYKQSVLFTTRKLSVDEANKAIFAQGLAALMRVYRVHQVKAVPLAGSGKVALSTLDRWATELEKGSPGPDLKAVLA